MNITEAAAALLRGAIDLHIHAGPDSMLERKVDALEVARQAREAGMRAVVLKGKTYPTSAIAALVARAVPGVEVYGGVCLDHAVGGLNPYIVESEARLGARFVWLPTIASTNNSRHFGPPRPPIRLRDDEGRLLPEVHDILDLARQHDLIVASGHVTPPEFFAVVEAAREHRVSRLLVNHPVTRFMPQTFSLDEQRDLARRGVWLEHCFVVALPGNDGVPVAELAAAIRYCGVEHCILASDLGQAYNPAPVVGLGMGIEAFLSAGFSTAEVAILVQRNPARVLGLEGDSMKVTRMDVYVVDAHWRNWIFVRLATDDGFTGVGEATMVFGDAAVLGALEDLREFVIGADPRRVEYFWSTMFKETIFHGPPFYSALAGIEHAMWDILGKWLGVPVYKLLGGKVRNEVRLYANTWFLGARTPDEYARRAAEATAEGWDALKWDPFPGSYMAMDQRAIEQTIDNVRAVRQAVGPDVDLLIETHGRLNAESAIRTGRELEAFNPFFYEEPVPPHNPEVMRKVRRSLSIPIAAGERRFTRWGMRPLLEGGAVDILQPDMTQAGGLLEVKKIAAMAESYQVTIAPHCPRGPVAVAAGVHFAASTPNFLILEYATDERGVPWRQELISEPERIVNGRMALPERPGLGVELNEPVMLRHKAERLIRRIPDFFNQSFTIQ